MATVTYMNFIDGKRHVLIDDVDLETAHAVAASWSDPREPNYYLNDVEVEA